MSKETIKHILFWVGLIAINIGFTLLADGKQNTDTLLGIIIIINMTTISFYLGYIIAKYKYRKI
ncbi:hypothetical protein D0T56_05295 [Dysgonomonas sp. 520]|nr:hypothetical protein [Dysgonomonas sp. 520]